MHGLPREAGVAARDRESGSLPEYRLRHGPGRQQPDHAGSRMARRESAASRS